jgi:hypothetical protein
MTATQEFSLAQVVVPSLAGVDLSELLAQLEGKRP